MARADEIPSPLIEVPESSPVTETPTTSSTARGGSSVMAPKGKVAPKPPALITFRSMPSGAKVTVDKKALPGRTPIFDSPLRPGKRVIKFELENYQTMVVDRSWKSGEEGGISMPLKPLPAHVTIITSPPGAAVWANGQRLLVSTPVYNFPLPVGPTTFELHEAHHAPVTVKRDLLPNAKTRIEVELPRPDASASFTSSPPGATVVVNGKPLPGKTPIVNAKLPSGRSTIEVSLEGYETAKLEREWAPQAKDVVAVKLQPLSVTVDFISSPPGALVFVGLERLPGVTPMKGVVLPPGQQRVQFRMKEHKPEVLDLDWAPGTKKVVEAELAPLTGKVRIESKYKWDRIEIDGRERDDLDETNSLTLQPGRHAAIAYNLEGTGSAAFVVEAGDNKAVELEWRAKAPDSKRYVLFPMTRASLGSDRYEEENPKRSATVPGFWMSRSEVTVAEYQECVNEGKCTPPLEGRSCNWGKKDRNDHPVNCVDVYQAEAYAAWLSERDALTYRLPTGDEWERAARGTDGRPYPWGTAPPAARCNTCDKSCRFQHFRNGKVDDGWSETAPVTKLPDCKSLEGIYDLVGNVAEWCRTTGAEKQYEIRGGSWGQIGGLLDPAFRKENKPNEQNPMVGFRLVVPHMGKI